MPCNTVKCVATLDYLKMLRDPVSHATNEASVGGLIQDHLCLPAAATWYVATIVWTLTATRF